MHDIADRAHTDKDEFAAIFEQRRTSSILIAGFKDLEGAHAGLGTRISANIQDMAVSVGAAVIAASWEANARAANEAERFSATSRHQDDVRWMLDNIQTGRKPIF